MGARGGVGRGAAHASVDVPVIAAFVRLAAAIVVGALALSPPAFGQADPARTAPDKLYLVVFSLGPAWYKGKAPPEQTAFREHGANLKRLRDAKRIAMGARYADKGMIVLRAPSEAAARAEVEADPGVKAGIFTFEVDELRVFYPGVVGDAAAN